MAQLTHKEFLERLEKSNDAYQSGEIEILTEYRRQDEPVEVKTKYGVCLMHPQSLWLNAKPRMLSAKDKNEYFTNMLKEVYGNNMPDIISEYLSNDIKILINTKYGICKMSPSMLLKGNCIGIDSAVNKNEYTKNRCKEVHGDKYDYSSLVYIGASKKAKIICPEHGEFEQNISDHLRGFGCPRCSMGDGYRPTYVTKSKDDFISDLLLKNSQYKNGEIELLTEYTDSRVKILVKDKYGVCEMLPKSLLGNSKTSIFSAVDKTSYFINKVNEVNKCRYTYDKTIYNGTEFDVTITCPIHGDFYKKAGTHLLGKGCPHCGKNKRGWNRSNWARAAEGELGTLYVLKCFNEYEEFLKVGITCKGIKHRFRDVNRMPYNYEVLHAIESMDRNFIWNLEKSIHKQLGKSKYVPKIKFEGHNECFDINTIEEIKQTLNNHEKY